jgi:hypothetical protein
VNALSEELNFSISFLREYRYHIQRYPCAFCII